MLNFCVIVFILYAVGGSVRAILFGNKSRKRTMPSGVRRYGAVTGSKVKTPAVASKTCCVDDFKLKRLNRKRPELISGRLIFYGFWAIILQLFSSLSSENAAFAGLVEGIFSALMPVKGKMYLL